MVPDHDTKGNHTVDSTLRFLWLVINFFRYFCVTDFCGIRKPYAMNKIVGGEIATPGKYIFSLSATKF